MARLGYETNGGRQNLMCTDAPDTEAATRDKFYVSQWSGQQFLRKMISHYAWTPPITPSQSKAGPISNSPACAVPRRLTGPSADAERVVRASLTALTRPPAPI